MAAILRPKFRVTAVNKTSTEEQDKANDNYGAYEIVAEIRFTLYSDRPTTAVLELAEEAKEKLGRALS